MIRHGVVAVVLSVGALGTTAVAELTIDVGRFSNTHPVPSYSYVGSWDEYVCAIEVDGCTVFDINVAGIMSNAGAQYLRSISIRDFGNNAYGELSPGADIDLIEFIGLPEGVELDATYTGPTVDHVDENTAELLARVDELDAFTGANQRDDDVYVSLGHLGELNVMFGDINGSDDGGGIDPNSSGLSGCGFHIRIAEAGSHERFTLHLETSNIPAPAAAPVLAALLGASRRRRR